MQNVFFKADPVFDLSEVLQQNLTKVENWKSLLVKLKNCRT